MSPQLENLAKWFSLARLLGIKARFHPRQLPNQWGYKFVARLVDGTEVPCETFKSEFTIRHQIRTIESKTTIPFLSIVDWTEL